MKIIAATVSFCVAVTNVQAFYIYSVIKQNDAVTVDMTCTLNVSSIAHEALQKSKYDSFVAGSQYNPYPMDCTETPCGKTCFFKTNSTVCELGNEGDFCRYYGGTPALVRCIY